MDWYLDKSGTVPVSSVKINGWYKLRLEHTFEVHQKYNRYILNAGGRNEIFFFFPLSFFKTIVKPTTRLVLVSGTKAAPLVYDLGTEDMLFYLFLT